MLLVEHLGRATTTEREGASNHQQDGNFGRGRGGGVNHHANNAGGIGDTTNLPVMPRPDPPVPTADDELYNVVSLMNEGDTGLDIATHNWSNNDNVYFAGFYLNGILPTATYRAVLIRGLAQVACGGSHDQK